MFLLELNRLCTILKMLVSPLTLVVWKSFMDTTRTLLPGLQRRAFL